MPGGVVVRLNSIHGKRGAGKRTHICKEYDKYMCRKAFGADVCKDCRYASQTKKWGAVCFMPQPKSATGLPA